MKQTFRNLSSTSIAAYFRSVKWFTHYFGIGIPPALVGAIYAAGRISLTAGVAMFLLQLTWALVLVNKGCSRCRFYGTTKCGLPGKVAELVVAKKDPWTISTNAVRWLHRSDLAIIVAVNLAYAIGWTEIYPVIAICTLGGWLTVFRRKRFHGLLYRLRDATHAPDHVEGGAQPSAQPVSVPVTIGRRNVGTV